MNAPLGYREIFPGYRVPRNNFDKALHALTSTSYRLARDGRRSTMLKALDNRVTWGQVKHWRAGRRRVPAWVWRELDKKLAERQQEAAQARAGLPLDD